MKNKLNTLNTKSLNRSLAILIIAITLFSTTKINAQSDLWCLEFQSSLMGITAGDSGTVKQTSDGGLTWELETSGTTNTLKKTGILNNDNIVVVGFAGTIIKTTDYGDTWKSKSAGTTVDLYGVSFGGRESEVGIAVGANGTIIRSSDQGESWTLISSNTSTKSIIYTSVSFASGTKGILVGQKGTLLITTDGGFTWSRVPTNIPKINYKFVLMLSEDIAYVTGDNGTIIKTTDGGMSWISLNTNSSSSLYRIRFADDQIAIAVGSGGEVLKTTDGGNTWNTEISGVTNNLNCLFVIDENVAFAGGQGGIILKTTDGGISWSSSANPKTTNMVKKIEKINLFTNYPNPSNPVTTIKYYIASYSSVTLKIYDAVGREVRTLVNQNLATGIHTAQFDGSNLPSGVYFGKLLIQSPEGISNKTMKIVLVK